MLICVNTYSKVHIFGVIKLYKKIWLLILKIYLDIFNSCFEKSRINLSSLRFISTTVHYFSSKIHWVLSLCTSLIKKPLSIKGRKIEYSIELCCWMRMSLERTASRLIPFGVSSWMALLTLYQSSKVECPHSCDVGGKRRTDRRSAETSGVWRGLHHLVLAAAKELQDEYYSPPSTTTLAVRGCADDWGPPRSSPWV